MITKIFGTHDANTLAQITDVASRARYAALMPDCDSSDPINPSESIYEESIEPRQQDDLYSAVHGAGASYVSHRSSRKEIS